MIAGIARPLVLSIQITFVSLCTGIARLGGVDEKRGLQNSVRGGIYLRQRQWIKENFAKSKFAENCKQYQ